MTFIGMIEKQRKSMRFKLVILFRSIIYLNYEQKLRLTLTLFLSQNAPC